MVLGAFLRTCCTRPHPPRSPPKPFSPRPCGQRGLPGRPPSGWPICSLASVASARHYVNCAREETLPVPSTALSPECGLAQRRCRRDIRVSAGCVSRRASVPSCPSVRPVLGPPVLSLGRAADVASSGTVMARTARSGPASPSLPRSPTLPLCLSFPELSSVSQIRHVFSSVYMLPSDCLQRFWLLTRLDYVLL